MIFEKGLERDIQDLRSKCQNQWEITATHAFVLDEINKLEDRIYQRSMDPIKKLDKLMKDNRVPGPVELSDAVLLLNDRIGTIRDNLDTIVDILSSLERDVRRKL